MKNEGTIEEQLTRELAELRQRIVELERLEAQHKQAYEKLREQAALLDKAQDAIILLDMKTNITYWNKNAEHLYGWTEEEVTGKNASKILGRKELPQFIRARESTIEKGEWLGELCQVTKEGKEITVESRWTLVCGNRREPESILIINTDITLKKKLEVQRSQAKRMESLSTLADGFAHGINNALTPIMLSLQILEERFTDDESQKMLKIIERNTKRGTDLVKHILTFARGIEGERNIIQMVHIISEIEKNIKETFSGSIEVRIDMQKDLWDIIGDSAQLYQVIMELCVNAREAMPYGGTLSIYAENFSINGDHAIYNTDARADHYVIITISDTGTGISPQILDRIFEPFFTTKKCGKDIGLGLSTALGIVKSHGGFIDVRSEVGKGTVFKIYLPAITTQIITEKRKIHMQQYELSVGHGELVFVVDDEASIRESTRTILETHGYRAITACDGAEATALYMQHKEVIEVVLMDMMMPVMDGQACIRVLRKINPDIKIIAVSGLTESEKLIKGADTPIHAFLAKPYTAQKLLGTIYEVLGK